MLEAVGAEGYGQTSVRTVIDRTGLYRQAFYDHFTDKRDCYLQAYDEGVKWVETLTLGALRLLRNADLIVFDDGVPPAVLDFARREAHRHPVFPNSTGILDRMIAAARGGERVVRLNVIPSRRAQGSHDDLCRALQDAGLTVVTLPSAPSASK